MNLGLTDEQAAIHDAFAAFFEKECPLDLVRKNESLGHSSDLWTRFVATGAPSMSVSSNAGGGGAGLLAAALVAEQAGRRLAPVPFVEHLVATRLLERAGGDGDLIRSAVEADHVVSLALRPSGSTARLVPAGAVARIVIGLDRQSGDLLAVEAEPPWRAEPNLASAPLAHRDMSGITGHRFVIATGPEASALAATALDEWRLLTAAALVGLAGAALDIGVDYVSTRHQFGVPIGTFQSIQHGLAEVSGPLSGARLLAAKAAWVGDQGLADLSRLAPMALLFASELASTVTRRALHYHGGYGVMEEYSIQMYYRRAKGWTLVLDDPARETQRLADVVLGPRTEGC